MFLLGPEISEAYKIFKRHGIRFGVTASPSILWVSYEEIE